MKKEELLVQFDTLNDEEKKALISSFFDRNKALENTLIDKEKIIKENKILITEQKTLLVYYEELLLLRNKEKYAKKSEAALGPLFDEYNIFLLFIYILAKFFQKLLKFISNFK